MGVLFQPGFTVGFFYALTTLGGVIRSSQIGLNATYS